METDQLEKCLKRLSRLMLAVGLSSAPYGSYGKATGRWRWVYSRFLLGANFLLVGRLVATFLVDDPETAIYQLGDLTPVWDLNRRLVLIGLLCFSAFALIQTLDFQLATRSEEVWHSEFLRLYEEVISDLLMASPEKVITGMVGGQYWLPVPGLVRTKRRLLAKVELDWFCGWLKWSTTFVILMNTASAALPYLYYPAARREIDFFTFLPWTVIIILKTLLNSAATYTSSAYYAFICLNLRITLKTINSELADWVKRITNQDTSPDKSLNAKAGLKIFNEFHAIRSKHWKVAAMIKLADGYFARNTFYNFLVYVPFVCFALHQSLFACHSSAFIRASLVWMTMASAFNLVLLAGSAASVSSEYYAAYELVLPVTHYQTQNPFGGGGLTLQENMVLIHFLDYLSHSNVGFTCGGLFRITRCKLSSILAGIVSYFFLVMDYDRRMGGGSD